MEFELTSESMELLIESIVDAVESTDDRDMQFELVKTILEENGIVEIKDVEKDENHYTPSSTNGDYGPSNPWDAPGMSIRDFI